MMVALWVLSWVVLPATLVTAVIVAFAQGLSPDPQVARRAAQAVVLLLLACLLPRLFVAPQIRPYPPEEEVVLTFATYTAIGLGAALLAFGLGHGIRRLWKGQTR